MPSDSGLLLATQRCPPMNNSNAKTVAHARRVGVFVNDKTEAHGMINRNITCTSTVCSNFSRPC
eukprot:m.131183 g.131183  ORF g.131183 m.131183 type:complete len:64 (+) comp29525_c0_seq1:980-1171(+)